MKQSASASLNAYKVDHSQFNAKNFKEQDHVKQTIKTLEHFKTKSKSPQKEKVLGRAGSEDEKIIKKFSPYQVLDLKDQQIQEAISNLGLKNEEFEKDLLITDYYDIKESRDMQIRRFYTELSNMNLKIQAVIKEYEFVKSKEQGTQRIKNKVLQQVLLNKVQDEYSKSKLEQLQKKVQKEMEKEKKVQSKVLEDIVQIRKNQNEIEEKEIQEQKKIEKLMNKSITEKLNYINKKKKEKIEIEKEKEKIQETGTENNKFDLATQFKNSKGFLMEQSKYLEQKEEKQKEQQKLKYLQDQKEFQKRISQGQIQKTQTLEEFKNISEKEKEIYEKLLKAENKKKNFLLQTQNNLKKYDEYLDKIKQEGKEQFQENLSNKVTFICQKYDKLSASLDKIKKDEEQKIKKIKTTFLNKLQQTTQRFSLKVKQQDKEIQQKSMILEQRSRSSEVKRQTKIIQEVQMISQKEREKQEQSERKKYELKIQKEQEFQIYLQKELERKNILNQQNSNYYNYLNKQKQVRFIQKKNQKELEESLLETLKKPLSGNKSLLYQNAQINKSLEQQKSEIKL